MKLIKRIRNSITGRWEKWRFRPSVIERQFAGESFKFLLGDVFGSRAYGAHRSDWPELDWIKAKGIRPGDTVVDCGANHGFTALLFSRWAGPTGKVHAFEPNPRNVAILKENVRLNELTNVVCHPIALDSQSRQLRISTHPNSSVQESPPHRMRTEFVSSATMDDVLGETRIDFLKIDVEGFELHVLQGAREVLAKRPRLDLELHTFLYDDPVQNMKDIFELLDLGRYAVEVQPEIDGPIRPWNARKDSIQQISECLVVHLFCS